MGPQGSGKSLEVVVVGGGVETDKGSLETLFEVASEAGRGQEVHSLLASLPCKTSYGNKTQKGSILFFLIFFFVIFDCFGSSLLRAGPLQLWRAGTTPSCSAQASHCGVFSCCGARALGTWASVVVARGLSSCGSRALERRLSSCGTWA